VRAVLYRGLGALSQKPARVSRRAAKPRANAPILRTQEERLLIALCCGLAPKEAAARVGISHGTARWYLMNAKRRLAKRTVYELVAWYAARGLRETA
jgi:DNA-binding NarL/FixJ family response regulator